VYGRAMRVLLPMLLATLLIGCGDKLTAHEQTVVAEAQQAAAMNVLDGSMRRETADGVDQVIALYRQKPDAEYNGLTMRQVLEDLASSLDGAQPQLAARIDRALS
jgi:hypothetical protein